MPYVIAEPCLESRDASCVDVCPVDCIHPRPDEAEFASADQLYINPEECIDCDSCVSACPVEACFSERDLPTEWAHFRELNARFYSGA